MFRHIFIFLSLIASHFLFAGNCENFNRPDVDFNCNSGFSPELKISFQNNVFKLKDWDGEEFSSIKVDKNEHSIVKGLTYNAECIPGEAESEDKIVVSYKDSTQEVGTHKFSSTYSFSGEALIIDYCENAGCLLQDVKCFPEK